MITGRETASKFNLILYITNEMAGNPKRPGKVNTAIKICVATFRGRARKCEREVFYFKTD